jgi:putative ABC transport system ATP-binding protein
VSAVIEAEGLTKLYPSDGAVVRAVDEVDVRVGAGEMLSVMGPSGCGKSTLLHLLGGLDRPDAGCLSVAGQPTHRFSQKQWARFRRVHIGFVFQAFHLVDELTAVENVELPALLIGTSRAAARSRAMQLLEQLGVADRSRHLPHRMSGGQQQRVALARAMVNSPALILADEPTGSLDSHATATLLSLFTQLQSQAQALLIVTHDPRVATIANRLLTMRDGRVIDETRLDPANPSTSIAALAGWGEQ